MELIIDLIFKILLYTWILGWFSLYVVKTLMIYAKTSYQEFKMAKYEDTENEDLEEEKHENS